jgi:hypothetical protein
LGLWRKGEGARAGNEAFASFCFVFLELGLSVCRHTHIESAIDAAQTLLTLTGLLNEPSVAVCFALAATAKHTERWWRCAERRCRRCRALDLLGSILPALLAVLRRASSQPAG